MRMNEGIYKGTGSKPWFAGELNAAGEPAATGPGTWAGEWFRTRKEALVYLELSDFERNMRG